VVDKRAVIQRQRGSKSRAGRAEKANQRTREREDVRCPDQKREPVKRKKETKNTTRRTGEIRDSGKELDRRYVSGDQSIH